MKFTININKKTLTILKIMFRIFVITPATYMFLYAIFFLVTNGGLQATIQDGFEFFTQLMVTQSLPIDQVTTQVIPTIFYIYMVSLVTGECMVRPLTHDY